KATHNGAVTLTASSRNFEEDMKLEVAKVNAAVEIKAEPITVKAGLKDQVGGKIVITETKEEKLAKNKKIIITADDAWGFAIEDAKIEVTGGDIQIEKDVNKDGELIITVKRSSSEASEITISDVKVTTNRTVPEGAFDFVLGGNAISQRNENEDKDDKDKKDERFADALTVKDFVKVGTKNTEDLPNAAAAKEIVLTVGAKEYTVNGEAKVADAAAYIDANNRTMVPVKFIAEEFGKLDFGTVNGVGTVTVFKDGAVLQFQNGSNIMNKNGIAIPMDTAVVIKDGRTYVPFKYVADGLGIGFSFDPATKSITFTNQVK
ncbi:MAG: stalk domain-containing protein, partial [Niameybacter sp.]